MAVGGLHLCALLSDHSHDLPGRRGSGSSIKCWGSSVSGQSTPPIAGNVRYIRIAVGLSHSCAVTNTFVLLCWGASEPVKGALMMSGKSTDGNTAGINLNTFL